MNRFIDHKSMISEKKRNKELHAGGETWTLNQELNYFFLFVWCGWFKKLYNTR